MMRHWISLIALAVVITMPLTAVAAEVVDCCGGHEPAPRMREFEGCAEPPCCLSPATPAASRDSGRLTEATPPRSAPPTEGAPRVDAPAYRLPDPPGFHLPGLRTRLTTVLRC